MRFFEDFEYVTFFIVLILGSLMYGLILLVLGPLIVQFTDDLGIEGITPGGISMVLGYSLVAAWHVSINIDQVPKKKDEDEDED